MNLLDLYLLHDPAPGEAPPGASVLSRLLKQQTERRQQIAKAALAGKTQREIGAELGISHGTVRYELRQTMHLIRKEALGLPRYLNEGRPKNRGYGKKKSPA